MGRLLLGLGSAAVLLAAAGLFWWSQTGPAAAWQSNIGGSSPSPGDAELAPEKQKLVWDGEHVAFEFETHFGRGFAQALEAKDEGRLGEFFHPDFGGAVLDSAESERRTKGILSEVRLEA